ncbi:MAG: hypothetical protein QM504_16690 [Pseudomonadota bacterium]
MQENKLLASVVLFRELYDSDKDIYDVIGELIKAAIHFEKKWSFNTTEATQLLEDTFGFILPESVVKTTLKNRLKNQEEILTYNAGVYSLVNEEESDSSSLSAALDATKAEQNRIINDLISYIEHTTNCDADEDERNIITTNFTAYLLDELVEKKYLDLISSYIIERQSAFGFTESLNAVREGFVLYNGTRYTPDLNDIGLWKTELTIYLDTEHLFNSAGFNGVLFKQLFDDFYNLVKEINHNGKKYITLKYFSECKDEIDGFFHVAELILEKKFSLDPSKNAMISILENCKNKSDILEKKAKFYSQLDSKRIKIEERRDYYDDHQYNIEDSKLISEIQKQVEETGRTFDEEKCVKILKAFTRINYLRRGISSGAFEKIGYILMSGNNFTRFLTFNPLIKTAGKDIPFATDIDFITNRFWFKLKKGLTNSNALPKSMDVVAKAQVALSSHINSSVSEKFELMKQDFSEGKITKEDAEYLHHELRTKTTTPEKITQETLEDALSFLSMDGFENHLREKSILERKAAEGEKAIKRIEVLEQLKHDKQNNHNDFVQKIKNIFITFSLIGIIVIFYAIFAYLIYSLKQENDSNLTILGIIFSFFLGTIPLFKFTSIRTMLINKTHNK